MPGATVQLSASGTANAITQPSLTDANGMATGSLASTKAETKTLSVFVGSTNGNVTLAQHPTVAFVVGAAAKLAFTVQPTQAQGGSLIAPSVQVAIEDVGGNIVSTATNAITIALGTSANPGVLSGTKTTNAVNGVATFGDLSVDKIGTGYSLVASASGVAGATSSPFNIVAGPISAARSSVVAAPTVDVPINSGLSTVTVTVTDAGGNPLSGQPVTLTATGTGNTIMQPSTTNSNGVATGTISSTKAETKTITASVSAIMLSQSATVMFVAFNPMDTGLPANITCYGLALDPVTTSTLYLASSFDVYKSVDSAANWSALAASPTGDYSIAVDPISTANVYCGTQGQGIYKTTNSGTAWTAMNSGIPANTYLDSIAIDPTNSSVIYAGSDVFNLGVYKSTDGASTWTAANSGLPSVGVRFVVIDRTNSAVLYAGTFGNGVFKTTNSASSWTALTGGLPSSNVTATDLAIDPTNDSVLYLGVNNSGGNTGGVYKSTDGGANWTSISAGLIGEALDVTRIAVDPSNVNTLYMGSNGGLFKSKDAGATWKQILTQPINVLAVDPKSPMIVYAGASGIYKTTTGGE